MSRILPRHLLHPWGRKPVPAQTTNGRAKSGPTRVGNILARHGITVEEAQTMTDEDLLVLPNFGKTCLALVRDAPERIQNSNEQARQATTPEGFFKEMLAEVPPPAPPIKREACCPGDLQEADLAGNMVFFCPNHGTYFNPHFTKR